MMTDVRQKRPSFYLPQLDVIRFFSFLLIFLHHLPGQTGWFGELQRIGWIGVDIFFCLSGFLLTRLLLDEHKIYNKISFRNFFIRRILRIWPLYIGFVLVVILYVLLKDIEIHNLFLKSLGLLSFTDNLVASLFGYNTIPYTGHLWTISIEEQFYVLLSIVIWAMIRINERSRWWFLLGILFLGWIWRLIAILYHVDHPFIYVIPVTHLDAFFVGVLISVFEKNLPRQMIISVMIVTLITIIILPGSDSAGFHLMILYPAVALLAGSIVYICKQSAFHFPLASGWSVVVYLGKISFGLYVFHLTTIDLAWYVTGGQSFWFKSVSALFITIGLAAISYALWEKPFLKLKSRFTRIGSKPL